MYKSKLFSIALSVILCLSFLPLNPTLSSENSNDTTIKTAQPLLNDSLPNNKVSAEEENTDSWDVNGKSGRWSVTDTNTDDTIIDSNLRVISSDNDTSSNSEYFAQRGLTKSDAKYEYRYKASYDGDNTSEYFRDVLGDSADFSEDTDNFEFKTGSTATVEIENGLLKISITGTSTTFSRVGLPNNFWLNGIDFDVFKDITYRIKCSETMTIGIQSQLTVGIDSSGTTCSTEWQTFIRNDEITGDPQWTGEITLLQFVFIDSSGNTDGDEIIYLDYFKKNQNTDYATHDESLGDTWDWEDSLEYFFDVEGNVSDFNDGTTEDWTLPIGDTIANLDSEFLNVTDAAGTITTIARTGLSISASGSSGFDYFTMEFNASIAITDISINDGTNEVCADSTGWTATDLHLFSCDLDLDADWTGTETDFEVTFSHANTALEIHINMIYLYDVSLGDLEGYTSSFDFSYVNPEGFLHNFESTTSSRGIFKTGLSIDSSIFDILEIRLRTSTATTMQFLSASGSPSWIDSQAITTSFVTYIIDLSLDVDWTGTITDPFFRFAFSSGSVEIDYILLLKSSNETQNDIFTIGLFDQDASLPLLNVSQHFFNNTNFQWRVLLMDSTSQIVSFFFSSNRTYSDVYYRAKVTYNILQSELAVELKTDGNSRIFRINYPDDFTNNGTIPQLFAHEKSADIFFSSHSSYMTASETWIDFIESPFKENEWTKTIDSTSSNWIVQQPLSARVQDNISSSEDLGFQINVPKLDAVSGKIKINSTDNSNLGAGTSLKTSFKLYSIDASSGTQTELIELRVQFTGSLSFISSQFFLIIGEGASSFSKSIDYTTKTDSAPEVFFSFGLVQDRSELNIKTLFVPNGADPSIFYNFESNVTINEIDSNPSQEFVLETYYQTANVQHDLEVFALIEGFAFLERDIFIDIAGAVGGILDVGGQIGGGIVDLILKPLFDFLAIILRAILSGVSAIIIPLLAIIQSAVEVAVSALGVLLDAAIGLVTAAVNALGEILGTISTAIADIVTAIGEIVSFIGSFILDLLADFLTWIEDTLIPTVISFVNEMWDLVWTPILNLFGLKSFVDGIMQVDYSSMVSDFIVLFGVIATLLPFLVLIMLAFITIIPFVTSQDPRTGRVNMFEASSKMSNNAFGKGFQTPNVSFLGFGFAIFIPLIILLYIALKILIAEGTFPDIFGGLPI